MMKYARNLLLLLVAAAAIGCSVAPERAVTRQELYKTNVFSQFTIKDSPESVLAILNRDGEAVLEGKSKFGDEYFIKILATGSGLKVRLYAK
jgi:hypothetical protein